MKKPLQSLEQPLLALPFRRSFIIPNPIPPLRANALNNLIIPPTNFIHNILHILIKTLKILQIGNRQYFHFLPIPKLLPISLF